MAKKRPTEVEEVTENEVKARQLMAEIPSRNPDEAPWEDLWRSIKFDALYVHTFGFERAWRGSYEKWGYPLNTAEYPVTIGGKQYQARTFHKIGLVYWDPAKGPIEYGFRQ